MSERVGLVRSAIVVTTVMALGVMLAGQAGAEPAAIAGKAGSRPHETASDTRGQHGVTLAERRAEVRAETTPAHAAAIARQLKFQRPRPSPTARPRLPEGERIGAAGRPTASSTDVWAPTETDAWLTDPAGGVVAAFSEAPAAPYDQVPAPLGVFGEVNPGERVTITDEVSLTCLPDNGCDYDPSAPPTRQVTVHWQVYCQGGPSDTLLVPSFGTQTVTAQPADIGQPPPVLAQATFTMPTSATCPILPVNLNQPTPNVVIQTYMVISSSGNTNDGETETVFPWEVSGIPPSQTAGAPCAADSADPGQVAAHRGDPVNTLTGECTEIATDATLKTPGYPLLIQRNYSTALAGSPGPLGSGWMLPWFASLSVSATTGNVTFNAENGSQYVFTDGGGSIFGAPPGVRSVLRQLPSGNYTLTTPQQDVLTFSSSGRLLSEVDPTGRGLSFAYSGAQLTSVTDAAGQQVTLTYSGGLLTKITLPNTQTIAYGYTGGQLTSATVPGGTSGDKTTYAYDASSRLITITDPDGHVLLQNTYDAQGRIVSQTDGAGAITKFSYTTTSSGLDETDTTDPDGGIQTDLYGGNVLLETIDPLGRQTQYAYDVLLDPVAVTDPAGGFNTMTYDGSGNLLSEIDPLGNEQLWTYDGSNNVTSYTDADDDTTSYTYNGTDEVTSLTDQDGDETTYAYDGSGNLTSSVDPRGNVSGATAANYTTTYSYNAQGQLISMTNPAGSKTSYVYDSMGYLASLSDPAGHLTSYSYDSDERLLSVTAPDGGITKYGYDGAGNTTSRTDPDGHTWSYGYDGDNRLESVTDPLGQAATYGYDGDGNQTTFTDARAIVTTTAYDADNRPLKITYSDGTPSASYNYDANGNLTSVTDATGTRTMTYDPAGELTRVSGPGSGSFSYAYDPSGDVTSRAYPDGTTAAYTYSDEGQIASMTVGAATSTYSYDAAGNLVSSAMPNGVTESRTYNGSSQVTRITDVKGSSTLDSYALTLNADGLPTEAAITQNGTSQAAHFYGYDANGRLTSDCRAATGCSVAAAGSATGTAVNPAVPGAPTGMVTSGVPGKCLDDAGGNITPGNKVDESACTGAAATQQWTVESDGTVRLGGLCLDVKGNGTANGSLIDLFTCKGSANQQWKAVASQGLENPSSGKCLEDPAGSTANGTQLDITTCANTAQQHWRLPYNGLPFAGELTSGIAGKCLDDAAGSITPGNKVDESACTGAAATQLWTVGNDGTVRIGGLCLDVKGNGTANGSLIDLFTCKGSANQKWVSAPFGYLINPVSGKCLEDPAGSTANGTQLDITTCANTAQQHWTLPSTTIPATPTGVAVTAGSASATLTWTLPAATGGSALTGYIVTASPGGATATAGPYATSATVAGLSPATAYTFTLTASNRLGSATTAATTAVTPGNEITYGYDKAGALTGSESDGLTTASTYNADEELTKSVTGTTTTSYAYNADGDQTTAGTSSYSWNGAGEMSQAVTPAGTFGYGYDAGGNLATTRLNGSLVQGTTWDVNNPLPQVAEETSSTGAATAKYLYGPANALASMTTSAGTYYPVTDWLGSVTGLVSSSGGQVSTTAYSPYGTPSVTSLASGAPASTIGYAGSYTLPGGTGLDDMRARDYNPAAGGFTSVDPALTLTDQPYAYAGDAPDYLTDPSGLCSWFNVYCDAVEHWRGALQVTAFTAGFAALVVCTAATDGLCAVAIEVAGLELPIGPIAASLAVNEAEGAFDYAVSGGCEPKTASGLMLEIGKHALGGLGEGIGDEFIPTFQPAEGAHAAPATWWEAWSEFSPFE